MGEGALVPEAVGNDAAIFGELRHHCFMKSDILFGAAMVAGVDVEVLREFLAGVEAGIEMEEFEEVDDRRLVIPSATFHRRHFRKDGADVDLLGGGR